MIVKIDDNTNDKLNIYISCNKDIKDCNLEGISTSLYEFNDENFIKTINKLESEQLIINSIEKNTLVGTINVKSDNKYLFVSIPYDEGWKIYVDGKKVEYESLFDSFIGIKLNKGKHTISMKYIPKGFNIGIVISLFTVVLSLIYNITKKSKKTLLNKKNSL